MDDVMNWRSNIDLIQKLYVAFYGRPADPGGLRYWASVIPPGTTDEKTIRMLINWFTSMEHEEARMYSSDLDATLSRIFFNAFNRDITQAEKAVIKSVDDALIYIINLNSGSSYEVFKAKVEYAKKFTSIIDPNGDGIPNDDGDKFAVTYNDFQDILKAQSLLRLVNREDNLEDKVKKDIFDFIAKQDDKFYKLYIEQNNQNNLGQDQPQWPPPQWPQLQCPQVQVVCQCQCGSSGDNNTSSGNDNSGNNNNQNSSNNNNQCSGQGQGQGQQETQEELVVVYNTGVYLKMTQMHFPKKVILTEFGPEDVLDFTNIVSVVRPVEVINFKSLDIITLSEDFTTEARPWLSKNVVTGNIDTLDFNVEEYDIIFLKNADALPQIRIIDNTGNRNGGGFGYLVHYKDGKSYLYSIYESIDEDNIVHQDEISLLAVIDFDIEPCIRIE